MSFVSMAQKTNTATKTAIDVAQSQKLIHTMLGMSFGCVAFLRGVFPDDSFTDQRFIPHKFETDYNAKDPLMRMDALKVKTLVRGKSPQVDQFLNWLDMGVVDALRKGLLKSLILGIFLNENRPEDLHEVYTFSFDYTGNKIKLELSQGDTEVVTLLNARQTLQQVMRRLIVVTQGLSPLPEKKFVTMRMLFNDSCPKEYQPPGFKDASHAPPAVIKTKKRNFESYTAGDITTGCHDINVKVMMSSGEAMTDDVDMIEIDPFSISNKTKKARTETPPTPPPPQLPTQEVSQTTRALRHYLKGEDPTGLTQPIRQIKCQCGSNHELEFSELARCASCGCLVHCICYAITDKTIPYCYSCRSRTLGGIELHSNLSLLMNLRKFNELLKTYRFASVTKIHEMMGLDEDGNMTVGVISLAFTLGLIEIQDACKPPVNVATERFQVDMRGIKNGEDVVEEDLYRLVYVPQLKRKPREKQTRLQYTKKLLLQTTKDKCLCIDDELDQFVPDGIVIESDAVNSSDICDDEIMSVDLKELKIEDTKRRRDDSISQESIVGNSHNFSSNPVVTQPRKLRKTSAAILLSLIE